MKCICIVLLLSFGLRSFKAENEVTELMTDNTETPIISAKDGSPLDSVKNYEDEPNELEARLPSDSQSIRSNIIDTKFNCRDHEPGYYADIENECQIFHRCLEGQERVFSFICPEQTIFSQRALVCVWNDTRDLDCDESESFYEESNRAFSGNITAESNINDNMKNSTEITDMEVEDIENDETRTNMMSENIKHLEIPSRHEFDIVNEESEMIEKNSIEEKFEQTKIEEETEEESTEFQAELIPSSLHDIDASLAVSNFDSASHPQKISISVLDPIIEMPSADQDQLQADATSRNIRKRSGNHRTGRFLFKADAH